MHLLLAKPQPGLFRTPCQLLESPARPPRMTSHIRTQQLGRHRPSRRHDIAASAVADVVRGPEAGQSAAPVVRALDSEPGAFRVQGQLATPAAEGTVWRVLTDYAALPKVYRTVRESWAETAGAQTTVVQVCAWEFLVFSGTFETRLRVDDRRGEGLLVFTLAEASSFMRSFEGRWQVESRPEGGCAIRHTLRVVPTLAPPRPFRGYTQRIFAKEVTNLLEDLSRELQRHL